MLTRIWNALHAIVTNSENRTKSQKYAVPATKEMTSMMGNLVMPVIAAITQKISRTCG